MKCPVCRIDMIVVEHKKIELDYCVKCSGVWFDSGELELLLDTIKGEEVAYQGQPFPISGKLSQPRKSGGVPSASKK